MAKVSAIQAAFNAGEVSPLISSRPDLRAYANGLSVCENFLPLIQGALMSRPGFRYVADLLSHTVIGRLLPFQFSTTQSYALEFGDGQIRFFTEHALLAPSVNISGAADNGSGLIRITTATHGLATGSMVTIAGVVGTTEANGIWTITVISATTFDLIGSAFVNAYISGGTAVWNGIIAPYLQADLDAIKHTQSNDVLYLVHPSYAPRKLSRFGAFNWTLTEIDFLDGPYLPINATTTTLTLGGTTGSVSVTASSITGINDNTGFQTTDIGRLIRWRDPATNWTWLEITARSSTTVVTATIRGANASAVTATTNWRLGAWSDTTGYPAVVSFHENRLSFGDEPAQQINMSRSGDYENFAPSDPNATVADSHAVQITLADDQVNRIRWMHSFEKGFAIGTVGGEWVVRPSNLNEAITPTNVKAVSTTHHGSANYMAVGISDAVIFIQGSRRKIREFGYAFERDAFSSRDLTILSEHIAKPGIKHLAFQEEPHSLIWSVRDDGELVCLARERDNDVAGFARVTIGGISDAAGTKAKVESVIAISAPSGDRDEIWVITQRWIGGAVKRFVEYMEQEWETGNAQEDAFFVDAGSTYDGAPATTIPVGTHLIGESVALLVDGAAHPDEIVDGSGNVTLDRAGSVVQAGFYKLRTMTSLPFEQGAADGSAVGKIKRITRLNVRFHETLGAKYGDGTEFFEIPFRSGSDLMDNPPPIFSGDKLLSWPGGYETQVKVTIRQEQPMPATVLSISPQMVTQDR